MEKFTKCSSCVFSASNPGTHHINCTKKAVAVQANQHGVNNGWCSFPFDFDQIWIENCTGFKTKEGIEEETKDAIKMFREIYYTVQIVNEYKPIFLNYKIFIDQMKKIQEITADKKPEELLVENLIDSYNTIVLEKA